MMTGKNKTKPGSDKVKLVARSKDLHHKFEVLETVEAGLALQGTEVKSLRERGVNFKDSYCRFSGHELFLVNMHISPYSHGASWNHDPERPRKLLLHKRELARWKSKVQERGLSIVPSRLYFDKGLAKLELALARGKKLHDRREDLKRKTQDREMERAIKRYK